MTFLSMVAQQPMRRPATPAEREAGLWVVGTITLVVMAVATFYLFRGVIRWFGRQWRGQ